MASKQSAPTLTPDEQRRVGALEERLSDLSRLVEWATRRMEDRMRDTRGQRPGHPIRNDATAVWCLYAA